MKLLKIALLALSFGIGLTGRGQSAQPIKQLLEAPYMRGATFSLLVEDTQSGKVLYRHDDDRLVSPASVLKTLSTATALELLGDDYRFTTSIQYSGTLHNGLLKGNLYIKGGGDPSLGSSHLGAGTNRFLADWMAAIRKAGIRKIEGAVIADESIFDTEGSSPKWLREDMGNYYAPGCYGLSVYDNLYTLSFRTGAIGTRPTMIDCTPKVEALGFANYLKAAAVSADSAYIYGVPFGNERFLYGVLPANRERYSIRGDIPDPVLFLAQTLAAKLSAEGISTSTPPSTWRIEREAGRWTESKRTNVTTTYSPPLREIARITNYVSHNLYANALLKVVGLNYRPAKNEVISSYMRGVRVTQAYWQTKGLDASLQQFFDGSGLAPANKVTARFIASLLSYMATRSAASEAFIASLPQPGVEGSVRNFLKNTPLQGHSRLKSGGFTGVRSYAGYLTLGGKQYSVALFSNNYACTMTQMTKGLEQLLLQLTQGR